MASLLNSTLNTRYLREGCDRYIRSDVPDKLTDEEIGWLLAHNVRTVIDLRAPTEAEKRPCRLAEHPDFEPEVIETPWFVPVENGGHRMWPHKLLGEGHFAAVLRKNEGESEEIPEISGEKLPKQWISFAKELDITLPGGKAVTFGQSLYWVPQDLPDLARLKVLRPGLELGEVKKDRFEPAHALALWLGDCRNVQSYPADSKQIDAYLHGNVVPSQKKGWCLVAADGYSLGWGKGDGTVLKNHYPKGLRRLG